MRAPTVNHCYTAVVGNALFQCTYIIIIRNKCNNIFRFAVDRCIRVMCILYDYIYRYRVYTNQLLLRADASRRVSTNDLTRVRQYNTYSFSI
jgi:hypothetical protein